MAEHPGGKKPGRQPLGRRVGAGLVVVLFGVGAIFGGEFLASELVRIFIRALDVSDTQLTIISYVLTQAMTLLLLGAAAHYMLRLNNEWLGLGRIKNWNFLFLLPIIYLIALALSATVMKALSQFLPGFDVEQAQELGLSQPDTQADLILLGVMLVVLVPMAEEFIFRGYLFGALRREFPLWVTAVVVSAFFGLAHGQWNVAVDTFILSLILCFIREKTGSIWTGVGLHALKNAVAFLLLFVYNLA